MKKFLIALALVGLSGCSYKTQIADLETKVAGLSQDKHDACAAVLEIMSSGIFIYVGEDTYINRMTGQEIEYPDLDGDCNEFLDSFREAVSNRQKERTAG